MSPPRIADSCLYEPDALLVAYILGYRPKVCSSCGDELPGNGDYFARDGTRPDGLTCTCRRCRRRSDAASYAALPPERKQARSERISERKRERRAGEMGLVDGVMP